MDYENKIQDLQYSLKKADRDLSFKDDEINKIKMATRDMIE